MEDMKLKCLKDQNRIGVIVSAFSKGEHVKQEKRFYRLIKERTRYYHDIIPFNTLPGVMVVHLMMKVMLYINDFVWTDGVSKFFSTLNTVE